MRRGFLCFPPGSPDRCAVFTLPYTCTLMKLNPSCGDNTRKRHNAHIHRTFEVPTKMIFTFTGSAELKLLYLFLYHSCKNRLFLIHYNYRSRNLCCKTASILCSITMSYMCKCAVPLHVKKNWILGVVLSLLVFWHQRLSQYCNPLHGPLLVDCWQHVW